MSTDAGTAQVMEGLPPRLQERLKDPKTVESLTRVLDQLDTMAFSLEALDEFLRRGDVVAENLAESVAEVRSANACGGEWLEDVPRLMATGRELVDTTSHADLSALAESGLLERLTREETLATLNRLLDALPLIALLVQGLDEFLRRGDTVADSIAEGVRELREGSEGLEGESLGKTWSALRQVLEAGKRLVDDGVLEDGLPKVVGAGMEMIEAGMLDPDVVRTLGQLGKAAVDSYHEAVEGEVEPIGGLWGLLRLSKDPEIQKVIGLGAAIARAFARRVL